MKNMMCQSSVFRMVKAGRRLMTAAMALGALLLGWLAELIGLRAALATTSALAFVVVLTVLPALRRRACEMEADPP